MSVCVLNNYFLAGIDISGGGSVGKVGTGGICIEIGGTIVTSAITVSVSKRENSMSGMSRGSNGQMMMSSRERERHKHASLMILKINRHKVATKDLPVPGS